MYLPWIIDLYQIKQDFQNKKMTGEIIWKKGTLTVQSGSCSTADSNRVSGSLPLRHR
jgi:hypothetical protein